MAPSPKSKQEFLEVGAISLSFPDWRLSLHWQAWRDKGADPSVVEVLRVGYPIPFPSVPPLSSEPIPMTSYSPSSIKGKVLEEIILLLVERGLVRARPSSFSGILQPYVCRLEDFRVVETSYRPLCPEPLHLQDTVQDGNHSVGSSFRASGRLDGLPQPERHILAGCTSGHPQVLEVCGPRQALPVFGSLFRPLHCSPSFHQGYGSSFDFSSQSGYLALPLLGRLTHSGPLSGGGSSVLGGCSFSLPRAWHSGQPGEVQLRPFSTGSVLWDGTRLLFVSGLLLPSYESRSFSQ